MPASSLLKYMEWARAAFRGELTPGGPQLAGNSSWNHLLLPHPPLAPAPAPAPPCTLGPSPRADFPPPIAMQTRSRVSRRLYGSYLSMFPLPDCHKEDGLNLLFF